MQSEELEVYSKIDIKSEFSEILSRISELPFGNSVYQEEKFVIEKQHSDPRKARSIGLQLTECLRSLLNSAIFCAELNVDLHKLKSTHCPTSVDKRVIDLKIMKNTLELELHKKLINDELVRFEYLKQKLFELPKFSRSDFENEEVSHFSRVLEESNQKYLDNFSRQKKLEDNF